MPCAKPFYLKQAMSMVACGKCNLCLARKRADWSFRIKQELKVADSAIFLTLTYNEESVPVNAAGEAELCKRDVQLFLKRLRKYDNKMLQDDATRKKVAYTSTSKGIRPIRYYTVGEYGTKTDRPHYHSIMFNIQPETITALEGIWSKGQILVGKVEEASIHYVTKYVINRHGNFGDRQKPFALISNRSGGIGNNYIYPKIKWHKENQAFYVVDQAVKQAIPYYYKKKVFNKWTLQMQKDKHMKQAIERNDKELARLMKFTDNPYAYQIKQIENKNELINRRINLKDTL